MTNVLTFSALPSCDFLLPARVHALFKMNSSAGRPLCSGRASVLPVCESQVWQVCVYVWLEPGSQRARGRQQQDGGISGDHLSLPEMAARTSLRCGRAYT